MEAEQWVDELWERGKIRKGNFLKSEWHSDCRPVWEESGRERRIIFTYIEHEYEGPRGCWYLRICMQRAQCAGGCR